MIIADTSVWIEFFRKREPIFAFLSKQVEVSKVLTLSCIFGELLQGAKGEREATIIKAYYENLPHVPEEDLWIEAGLLSNKLRLVARGVGLIDVVLMVAAQRVNSRIWTLDRKLLSVLPNPCVFSPW